MDPITIAVLAALAGGVGGEVGRQAWVSLTAVVRRRPSPAPDRAHTPGSADPERRAGEVGDVSVGESELTALENAPADRANAERLERVLRERAAADSGFEHALRMWSAQLTGGLAADPDAATELQRAVDAHTEDMENGAGERVSYAGDHIDFSRGTFTGTGQVVGKIGTQYQQRPPR